MPGGEAITRERPASSTCAVCAAEANINYGGEMLCGEHASQRPSHIPPPSATRDLVDDRELNSDLDAPEPRQYGSFAEAIAADPWRTGSLTFHLKQLQAAAADLPKGEAASLRRLVDAMRRSEDAVEERRQLDKAARVADEVTGKPPGRSPEVTADDVVDAYWRLFDARKKRPNQLQISKALDVDDRTIRNALKRAHLKWPPPRREARTT